MRSSEIASRSLAFYVFDHDAVGRDDLIGSAIIPLSGLDLSHTIDQWKTLDVATGDELEVNNELYRPRTSFS